MRALLVLISSVNFMLTMTSILCEAQLSTFQAKEESNKIPSFRPFEFAYQSDDGLGSKQHRREFGDVNGTVTGAYGYMDPSGMYRIVEYVADANGFRSTVKTNEPGTSNQSTADAVWIVRPPPNQTHPEIETLPPVENRSGFKNIEPRSVNITDESISSESKLSSLSPEEQIPFSVFSETQEAESRKILASLAPKGRLKTMTLGKHEKTKGRGHHSSI